MSEMKQMVKLHVLSDLHLECAAFEPDPDAVAAADVVVLAGDIHPGVDGMFWARKTFGDKPVVYIAGNHELYGEDFDLGIDALRKSAKEQDVHFLESDTVTIAGVRFLGCTLWTDFEFFGNQQAPKMMGHAQNNNLDFKAIYGIRNGFGKKLTVEMTLERHAASRIWLESELAKADPAKTVVVTHHLPHRNSTPPKYAADWMTGAYGSHLPEDLMLHAGLWIHGHTHSSANYRISDSKRYVRVVCNPRGISRGWPGNDAENSRFDPGLLISQLSDGNWAECYEPGL
jgi:Icc-related predicted phosphoesterase